ncbi:YkvA family protein [Streptomyces sp. NPDC051569]|uniref:YkvA family protein n=1 Tax=Streptomyces sp. NPDC051569 TaxID=3365661 RepID=UPI0037BC1497
MSSELQILIGLAAILVVLTLGVAITLAVRLVRARRALRKAGVPVKNRWMFWAAMVYLVLPTDLVPDPVYLDDIGFLLLALRSLRTSGTSGLPSGTIPYAAGRLGPAKRPSGPVR